MKNVSFVVLFEFFIKHFVKRNILFTGLEIAFEYNSRTGLSTIRLIYVMLRSWHISESHGKS